MNQHLAFLSVDIATLVALGLLAARIAASGRARPEAALILSICLTTAAHVILARVEYGPWFPEAYRVEVGALAPLLNLARNATPGLFMILVCRLYTEQGWPPSWLLGLFLLQLGLEGPLSVAAPVGLEPFVREAAPTMLQLLFAGTALYWLLSSWREDLVEARRSSRLFLAALLSIDVVASSLILRVLLTPDSVASLQAHLWLSTLNLVAVVVVLFASMGEDLTLRVAGVKPAVVPPQDGAVDPDAEALARLHALMAEGRLYRRPDLTVKQLAERLGLPEYRTRRLIHERLGRRNFNAFLHDWRIGEACRRLADPAERRTPILTIALDVGYRSMNTFARGFRAVTGSTPSAYRAQRLSDCGTPQIVENDANSFNQVRMEELGREVGAPRAG